MATEKKSTNNITTGNHQQKYDRHNTSMPGMALASVRASPNMDHTNTFTCNMYPLCVKMAHIRSPLILKIVVPTAQHYIYIEYMDYVWHGVFENSINVIANKNHLNRFRLTFRS